MTIDIAELRDHIADFDHFFRPDPHEITGSQTANDIPGLRSLLLTFDMLDGGDLTTE